MTKDGNNGPEVAIYLTNAQAKFLQEQIEATQILLTQGLGILHGMGHTKRERLEEIVDTIEAWKPVRAAVDKGLKE